MAEVRIRLYRLSTFLLVVLSLNGCSQQSEQPQESSGADAGSEKTEVVKEQSKPDTRVRRLKSGRQIIILGVGQLAFAKDKPALMLRYQTELNIDDRAALQKEAEEIWESFKVDVEKAGLSRAIISAHETPKSSGLVTLNKSYNFLFKKATDGSWRLISDPKRFAKTDREKQDVPTKKE